MKNIKLFFALFLIVGIVACEDFLDVEPTSSGDAATSIETLEDAKVMMNGIMRNMAGSSYYGRNFIIYADARGGDLAVYSRGRGLDGLYAFDHSPTTGSNSAFWSGIYHCILQVNNLLLNIDKLIEEGADDDFDDIKGQALTARAIMYFDLVRIYGQPYAQNKSAYGVPNITEPLDASAQPLRATVEENYEQILKDLNEAAPLLSKNKSNGYINYYANAAMRARVYLSMGPDNYSQALAAAEEVIDSSPYQLYSNSEWVESWMNQFGSESIFELGVFPSEGDLGNSSPGIYLRRQGHGSASAIGQFMASDYYLDRLGQDPDDVRWGVMDYDELGEDHLGASYKYCGSVNLDGDGKSTATAVNIKVIRLSELYLIAAEAALPTDKKLAAEYLNKIRSRAPNLEPATESTITLEMILDEKSKELFTEGQRFFDMMRLGLPIEFDDNMGGIPVPVPTREKIIDWTFYKTILPIPQDEINANPGLEDQQNPGY